MRFEDQYPRHAIQESVNQRLRREKQEKAERIKKLNQERAKARREAKKEMIGMAILIPSFFVLAYFGLWFLWAITPPHWW